MVANNQGPMCPQLPYSLPREAPRSKGQGIPSRRAEGGEVIHPYLSPVSEGGCGIHRAWDKWAWQSWRCLTILYLP